MLLVALHRPCAFHSLEPQQSWAHPNEIDTTPTFLQVSPDPSRFRPGRTVVRLVERGGFEPPKAIASRFTVCPVWPLRYLSVKPVSPWRTAAPPAQHSIHLNTYHHRAATRTESAPFERPEAARKWPTPAAPLMGPPELLKSVSLLLFPTLPGFSRLDSSRLSTYPDLPA